MRNGSPKVWCMADEVEGSSRLRCDGYPSDHLDVVRFELRLDDPKALTLVGPPRGRHADRNVEQPAASIAPIEPGGGHVEHGSRGPIREHAGLRQNKARCSGPDERIVRIDVRRQADPVKRSAHR